MPLSAFFPFTNPPQNLVVGLACNRDAAPLSLADSAGNGGWLLLAPYGEIPYWHEERPGDWKQYRQVFTRAQAERMAAAFNAQARRRGERFRGLPVYAGHPDADPKRWPDERRLGGVVAVEAREDGLHVRVAWNDLGEKNRAEGYLVYPSPAWLYDLRTARTSGVIAPDELRSVGLTNTPRIPDVPAWTNSEPPSPTDPPTNIETNIATHMDYKHLLIHSLGLTEDANDETIQAAADTHRQARTDGAALCAERDQARGDAARFRAAAINAQLDAAINAGRLSAAERAGFVEQFERDYDAALRELGERRLALNTRSLGLRPAGADLGTAHGRTLAFNARLDALMRPAAAGGKGLRLDAAIAEMRASNEDAALLQAMNG